MNRLLLMLVFFIVTLTNYSQVNVTVKIYETGDMLGRLSENETVSGLNGNFTYEFHFDQDLTNHQMVFKSKLVAQVLSERAWPFNVYGNTYSFDLETNEVIFKAIIGNNHKGAEFWYSSNDIDAYDIIPLDLYFLDSNNNKVEANVTYEIFYGSPLNLDKTPFLEGYPAVETKDGKEFVVRQDIYPLKETRLNNKERKAIYYFPNFDFKGAWKSIKLYYKYIDQIRIQMFAINESNFTLMTAQGGVDNIFGKDENGQQIIPDNLVYHYFEKLKDMDEDGNADTNPDDDNLYKFCQEHGIEVLGVLNNVSAVINDFDGKIFQNLVDSRDENFAIENMMNDDSAYSKFIQDVVKILHDCPELAGLDVDFESVEGKFRNNYTQIMQDISKGIKAEFPDKLFTTAVHTLIGVGTWDGPACQDLQLIGEAVDEMLLMTYDLHWATSNMPGVQGSYDWLNDVTTWALMVVKDPSKIQIGIPFYGYAWPNKFPFEEGKPQNTQRYFQDDKADHTWWGVGLTYDDGVKLLNEKMNKQVTDSSLEREEEEIYFTYKDYPNDRDGKPDQTKAKIDWYAYFQDGKAITHKMNSVDRYNIIDYMGGAGIWRMGGDNEEMYAEVYKKLKLNVRQFIALGSGTELQISINHLPNSKINGYLIKEDNTAPSLSSSGWQSTKPTTYTRSSTNVNKFYLFLKDSKGVISNVFETTLQTADNDTEAPKIISFSAFAKEGETAVEIEATITDNFGVASYGISESTSEPSSWTSVKPTEYTLSTASVNELYLWAKDAAGNKAKKSTSITRLADTNPPTFEIFDASNTKLTSGATIQGGGNSKIPITIDLTNYTDRYKFARYHYKISKIDGSQTQLIAYETIEANDGKRVFNFDDLGQYSIKVRSENWVGKNSAYTDEFIINISGTITNAKAPTLTGFTIEGPNNESIVGGNTYSFDNASDPNKVFKVKITAQGASDSDGSIAGYEFAINNTELKFTAEDNYTFNIVFDQNNIVNQYEFKVRVKDDDGQYSDQKSQTVTINQTYSPPNGIGGKIKIIHNEDEYAINSTIELKMKEYLKVDASGITGENLQFSFYLDGNELADYSSNRYYNYKVENFGSHLFTVKIKDKDDNIIEKSIVINITIEGVSQVDGQIKLRFKEQDYFDGSTIVLKSGDNVTVDANGITGEGLKFEYSMNDKVIGSFGEDKSVSVPIGDAGVYKFKVKIFDANLDVVIKILTIDIKLDGSISVPTIESNLSNLKAIPTIVDSKFNLMFNLKRASLIKAAIYNVKGQNLGFIINNNLSAGKYNIEFNANLISKPGVYFIKFEQNSNETLLKIIKK